MSRRALSWSVAAIALVAIVVVGVLQASDSARPTTPTPRALSRAELAREVEAKLAAAPPALAALHRQANAFLPGERDGLHARLRALRGHPVVINVWAAWCDPCRAELPVFQHASLTWGTRVAFIGIDLNDARDAARAVLDKIPLTYPSFDDPDAKIATSYRLSFTPSTIFYDAAGKRTVIHVGPYLDSAALDADIERYALRHST